MGIDLKSLLAIVQPESGGASKHGPMGAMGDDEPTDFDDAADACFEAASGRDKVAFRDALRAACMACCRDYEDTEASTDEE